MKFIPQHFLKRAQNLGGAMVLTLEDACRAANEELDRRLGPVVYGTYCDGVFSFSSPQGQRNLARGHEDTHQAQLIDITEIEGEKNGDS
jgi:hypothetical protein